jgi:uncharacterized protein YndB with AHSA1/START domain
MRALILAAALLASPAQAAVTDVSPAGFTATRSIDINAPPQAVWDALVAPAKWWNGQHSWSGDAKNLTLEPRVGGCFCEALPPDGKVQHLAVVRVEPGKTLNLSGSLGPLSMSGAGGNFLMGLEPTAGGTRLTWTYAVGGYFKGGIDKLAGPVDGVMGEQMARLKSLVEIGKP